MKIIAILAVILFLVAPLAAQDGATLFKNNCASCHEGGNDRAPSREALRMMAAERVLAAMETGPMISMASRASAADRRAIAEYVTDKKLSQNLVMTPLPEAMCKTAGNFSNPTRGPQWNGWGVTSSNTRFQDNPGFSADQVSRLKLKWSFGFPGDLGAYSQPTVVGGRVFVGSQGGFVYSLDAASGCIYWYFKAASGVRTAVSIGRLDPGTEPRYAAFFGDQTANAYALDAATGKLIWQRKMDDYPVARITGAPTFYNGRLYVPVASGEELAGALPDYECCRFRGSLSALDAVTGRLLWKTYTISETPRRTKKNKIGTQLWGPSGAPIWNSPTIDTQRNVIYVGTGNNYSDPPTPNSNAIVAFDMNSGKIVWSRQMTPKDAYNSGCRIPDKTNCPDSNGPDLDFSSSPILVTLANGKRAIVVGQKSGVVHAIDPDRQGEIMWQERVGKGGTMGGVQWGSAADQSNIYVALSDIGRIMLPLPVLSTDADPNAGGGMFALRLDNGKRVWYTPPPGCGDRKRCSPAQSAAVSAIPGIAFSGSVDGHMRAYSTKDGAILWDYDTERPYETANNVPARGGSIDGPGPAIAGGMIFFNSGYASAGGQPGNVLLAFSVDGK
jgi:polyvinyl alcohol dehydrogenase (cytochrome)